jgi:uncharacterized membrane protein (UPF0136 family)
MENVARMVIAIYGVVMFVGGLVGFFVGKSTKSLAAGIVSLVVIGGAYAVSRQQPKVGFAIGALAAAGLVAVFLIRIQDLLAQTPPGKIGSNIGLTALSASVAVFLLIALVRSRA